MNSIRENWFNNIPITGEQAEECCRIARSINDLARMYLDKKIQCNQTFKLHWGRVELDVDSKSAYLKATPNEIYGLMPGFDSKLWFYTKNGLWSSTTNQFSDEALETGFCCMQKIVNAYTWLHDCVSELTLQHAFLWGKPVKEEAK